MDPARKIRLKKQLVSAFLTKEKSVMNIDLVLHEHGLRTSDIGNWSDNAQYALSMLEGCADEVLVQLANYFELEIEPNSVPNKRFGFWEADYFRLFVSHTSKFKNDVGELKGKLRLRGISAFVAHDDIEPSNEWQTEIEQALQTCDAFCALLTDDFFESNWCSQEIGYAVGLRKFIVPIRISCDPCGFIGKIQALSAKSIDEPLLSEKIRNLLLQNHSTCLSMRASTIRAFRNSSSYRQSNDLIETISTLPALTEEELSVIREAVQENEQVTEAFGVRQAIPKLNVSQ